MFDFFITPTCHGLSAASKDVPKPMDTADKPQYVERKKVERRVKLGI